MKDYLTDPDSWTLLDEDLDKTFYMATAAEREKLFNESLSELKARVKREWAEGWIKWGKNINDT